MDGTSFEPKRKDLKTKKSDTNNVIGGIVNFGDKLVSLLSGLLAAALIVYGGYTLYDTFYTQQTAGSSWELLKFKPTLIESINDPNTPMTASGGATFASVNEDRKSVV